MENINASDYGYVWLYGCRLKPVGVRLELQHRLYHGPVCDTQHF